MSTTEIPPVQLAQSVDAERSADTMLGFTTEANHEKRVKQVFLGKHVVHECDIDCPDEEVHADLASGIRMILTQQAQQKKLLRRVLQSTLVAATLFAVDILFLGWHLQLFFGGDGH